jgi:hypothetical protein
MPREVPPLNLTAAETEWLARGLYLFAEIDDWKRRIDLAAMLCKIALFDSEGHYERLRTIVGIPERVS